MQAQYAIKKLEKLGFTNKSTQGRETHYSFYSFTKQELKYCIEFYNQDGRAICFGIRHKNDHSDSMSDYCATIFCDSIPQALSMCN